MLLYVRGGGHRWEQAEANKSQKWTYYKYWNHTTKPEQQNKAWKTPHGHYDRVLPPSDAHVVSLNANGTATVRLCSINILIFAFLLQHRHNERPAVQEMMDSRKPFSYYSSVRKIMMANGVRIKDWTLFLLFRRKIAHLQGWCQYSPIPCSFFRLFYSTLLQRKINPLATCSGLENVELM